jgi:hypothetical protein
LLAFALILAPGVYFGVGVMLLAMRIGAPCN